MIETAFDCLEDTKTSMKTGESFANIYNRFQTKLKRAGFDGLNLYGPAHGTGLQECEGPWVDNRTDKVLEPNMVFNIDVWIADENYGVRVEDCVLVKENGIEELTSWRREIIRI
jgi:Xaa-Pro aminopeptidase